MPRSNSTLHTHILSAFLWNSKLQRVGFQIIQADLLAKNGMQTNRCRSPCLHFHTEETPYMQGSLNINTRYSYPWIYSWLPAKLPGLSTDKNTMISFEFVSNFLCLVWPAFFSSRCQPPPPPPPPPPQKKKLSTSETKAILLEGQNPLNIYNPELKWTHVVCNDLRETWIQL